MIPNHLRAVAQALFDKGLNHLRKQGQPSMRGDLCTYRGGPGGTQACIVGGMIPDDRYNSEMDNNHREGGVPLGNSPEILAAIPELDFFTDQMDRACVGALLREMQGEMHDALHSDRGTTFANTLEVKANDTAHKWGLTYIPPAPEAGAPA